MARGREGSGRRFRDLVSLPPEKTWPDAAVHHGSRLGLLLALAFSVAALFPPVPRVTMVRYEAGMVAEEDVTARIPFSVPRSEQELEAERAAAAAAIPPTFEYRPEAGDRMLSNLDGFFQALDEVASEGPEPVEEALSSQGIRATARQVELLSEPGTRSAIRSAAVRATREIHPKGVIDASQAGYLVTQRLTVRAPDGSETSLPSTQVISTSDFYDQAVGLLPSGSSPEVEELLRLILIRFRETNYVYDAVETFRDKDQARESVPTMGPSVLQGEVLLRRGERVREDHLRALEAYEEALRSQGLLESAGVVARVPFLGAWLLNFVVLGILGMVLRFYRPEVYQNFRWVLVHGILILMFFLVAARIGALGLPPELLPISFVALTVAVLWDSRQALMVALIVGVLTGLQTGFEDPKVMVMTVIGGASAAFSVRAIRRRAQTWAVIAAITLGYAVTILAFALVARAAAVDSMISVGYAAMNATASGILAMGFLPLWEWFTRITTAQSLLEWADPNRSVLKRMAMEAPGTYAHSVNVANLSEAAANAIGANALLCRVGAYYHDIGKVLKPQYFIENQPGGRNPHDKLKPATSATIVREHVTEGLRLAREEKVPEIIEPFILEHHGTQRIGFFFQKALEEADEDVELDPAPFTYPGPRPQSRETAILMLADSVESTTKVLKDPTPDRIRTLVSGLVEARLKDGQLDEAPITLGEIDEVKETLIKVVSGMYHHRIDYPQTRHLTESGAGDRGPAEPSETLDAPDWITREESAG